MARLMRIRALNRRRVPPQQDRMAPALCAAHVQLGMWKTHVVLFIDELAIYEESVFISLLAGDDFDGGHRQAQSQTGRQNHDCNEFNDFNFSNRSRIQRDPPVHRDPSRVRNRIEPIRGAIVI